MHLGVGEASRKTVIKGIGSKGIPYTERIGSVER